jgi:hypothetical protein
MAFVGGAVEQLIHGVSPDAVGPPCTDYDAGVDRLNAPVCVQELREDVVRIQLQPRRRNPALHSTAEAHQVFLEDPLSFVLRKDTLKLPAAVDAIEGRDSQLRHVRAVNACAPDVLGGLDERRHEAD